MNRIPEQNPEVTLRQFGDILLGLVRMAYRAVPKNHGSPRPRPFEEWGLAQAACHAVEAHRGKPQAPERFLTEWLGFEKVERYHPEALWALVNEQLEKPLGAPDLWLPSADAKRFREEVENKAKKIRYQRYCEDRARGFIEVNTKRLDPETLQGLDLISRESPSKNEGGIKKPPPSFASDPALEEMMEFFSREDEKRFSREAFLSEARQILPEQQYEVLRLRLEGLLYEDIARKLGMATSTPRVHACRARRNPRLLELVARWTS